MIKINKNWLAILSLICGCTLSAETPKEAVTFKIDYTQNAPKFAAQFALGQPTGKLRHTTTVQRDTATKALRIGQDCATISYSAAQNLSPRQGSIELVVSNQDWAWNDNEVHVFMSSCRGSNVFYIYKHANDGLGAYFAVGKVSAFPRSAQAIKTWKNHEKHHIMVTYGANKTKLYLDGKLVQERKFATEMNFGTYFEVGSPSAKWGRAGHSLIHQLNCYNRILTAEQIAQLAQTKLAAK